MLWRKYRGVEIIREYIMIYGNYDVKYNLAGEFHELE